VYISYNDDTPWKNGQTPHENYLKIINTLRVSIDNDSNILDILQNIRDSLQEPNNFIVRVHLSFPITTMEEFMTFSKPDAYGLHYDPNTMSFFKTIYINIKLGKLHKYNEEYLSSKLSQCLDPITKSVIFRIFDTNFIESNYVFVKTLTGRTIMIEAKNTTSIYDVRKSIDDKEGIPPNRQRLIYAGRGLVRYDYLLLDYGIRKESTLHMVLILRGGMHHPSSGHNDYSHTEEPTIPKEEIDPLHITCPNIKLNEYFTITISEYPDCSLNELARGVHNVGKY